ncbi:MAG: hypothetical protein QW717_06935 [Candidatus Bathyarchaeia archaeon]
MMSHGLVGILLQLAFNAGKLSWQWGIREGLTVIFAFALFFIELIVLAFVTYLAGLVVVGRKRCRFSDAFMISLLGTVLSTLFVILLPNWIAVPLSIIVWLLLIKRVYAIGWFRAIAVGILIVIIYLAVLIMVAFAFGIVKMAINWLTSIMTWH